MEKNMFSRLFCTFLLISNLICVSRGYSVLHEYLFAPQDYTINTEDFTEHSDLSDNDLNSYALIVTALRNFVNGKLIYFDGIPGNNQCHINSLFVCNYYNNRELKDYFKFLSNLNPKEFIKHLVNNYFKKEELSLEYKQKAIKFLTLNFYLNSLAFANRDFLKNLITKDGQIMSMVDKKSIALDSFPLVEIDLAKLDHFIKNSRLINKAKVALGNMTFEKTQKQIDSLLKNFSQDEIVQELSTFSLNPSYFQKTNLDFPYFPKFMGLEFFLKSLNIPIIVKVKFICDKGIHIHNYLLTDNYIESKDPIIVIECLSSDVHSLNQINNIEQSCCNNLMNLNSKKHDLLEKCSFCKKTLDEFCPNFIYNQKEISSLLYNSTPYFFLLSIGADFTQYYQPEYNQLLQQKDIFPVINSLYKFYLEQARENNMSVQSESPIKLYIEHIYPDTYSHAIKPERLLDINPASLYN